MIIQHNPEILIITYLDYNSITCDSKSLLGFYQKIRMRRKILGNLFKLCFGVGIYSVAIWKRSTPSAIYTLPSSLDCSVYPHELLSNVSFNSAAPLMAILTIANNIRNNFFIVL